MAQLAISAAGAAVGFVASGFNPIGAQAGWAVGSLVGAQFGPKQKSQGPRLDDLRVTGAEYGQTIPWAAGHPRLAGQVWWASNRREVATTTSQGKGGGGAESTSYTYEVDILYGLTDRVLSAVSRIWLNGKLVWTTHIDSSDESVAASDASAPWSRMTVYTGADNQLPDPAYESAVTNAPAYRGRGSVFIEGLQLGNSGVIPNLTFEVVFVGESSSELWLKDLSQFDRAIDYTGSRPLANTNAVFGQSAESNSLTSPYAAGPIDTAGSLTVETWLWVNSIPDGLSPGILSNRVPSGLANGFNLAFSDKKLSFSLWKDNATIYTGINPISPSVFPLMQWVHVAGVYNGTSVLLFQDGVLVDSKVATDSIGASGGDLQISTDIRETFGRLDGRFDEIRVSNVARYITNFTPPTERFESDDPNVLFHWRCDAISSVNPEDETLRSVVEQLCAKAGLATGQVDASTLDSITKPVRAFMLAQVATTRSAIEQLMAAYFFESYLAEKLYFVPRAGSVLDTIDVEDMGAGLDSAEAETLPTQVGSDLEIPAQVSVSYSNVDADYTTATEHSDRLLSGQISTSLVQLPLGFTAAEGKGIADAILVDGYASRVTGNFSVPLSYSQLNPTNVVTAPDADGNIYRIRIVRRTDEGPLIKFEWVLDDATAIESAGITSADYTPTVDVALPSSTIMQLMDVPLLRDADNTLGHYVAATSFGATWPGAVISRSLDNVEYSEAARVNERAIIGVTTTALGNFTGIGFDEANTVTVRLSYGTISSSTRDGLLADATINNMMIGSELVRFRTASFVDAGIYTLSGLIRGQKGTEWAMAGHAVEEDAILLQTAGIRYVSIDLPSLSAERFYKGVTFGRSLASVSGESFTCEGVSLKPLSPVNLRSTVGTGNQITVTWDRRTRLACTLTGAAGIAVPLGELAESYEIDVVLIAGSVLKRTITSSSAIAIYTASMQTTDGIAASTPIRFDVYQISAIVGRGYVASLTTTGTVAPLPQITTLTVGGVFATDAALYATLGGVTYNYSSVGGDTNLDGIATSFASVIDAASSYTASAIGSVVSVTGAVSTPFPVIAGVSAGDNTTTWSLTQTASATVAGVSNEITFRWLNLSNPTGSNAYPLGMTFSVIVQRTDPALNLVYQYVTTPSGRTNYEVLPIAASAILTAFAASGDSAAYGLSMTLSDSGTSTLSLFTPASEPYNWTVQAIASDANVSGLVGNTGVGVTPATLRPQIVTLTLAGTPATGNVYKTILGGVTLEYTATGADTTIALVAAGLAGVIDAHADYIASSVGGVITITHASNNVPFTYSATVIASTVTLTATTTQEAA